MLSDTGFPHAQMRVVRLAEECLYEKELGEMYFECSGSD